MGTILLVVGGMAIVVGAVRVMIRLNRVNRERAQRRREAWRAAGGIGDSPGDYKGHGGGTGTKWRRQSGFLLMQRSDPYVD